MAKFRYLSKFATKASELRFVSQTAKNIATARKVITGFTAAIEITSGSVGALIKLAGLKETELGKNILEYLFWLELLSLSGELTVAIHNGLRKNAKRLVEKPEDVAKLEKQLDGLVENSQISRKQANEVLEELYEIAGQESKRAYKKAGNSVIEYEMLSESLLQKYIKDVIDICAKKGITLNIKWIDETHPLYRSETLGRFGNPITVKSKNFAQLELRNPCPKITFHHEQWHLEDFLEQGWKKYRKIQVETPWKHEEAVWERIYKNRNKYKEDEVMDSYGYYKDFMQRKGQIPKLKKDLEKLVSNMKN